MKDILLSLGANIDDPSRHLQEAILLLKEDPRLEVIQVSSTYLTTPEDFLAQPDFLNCVVYLQSNLSPVDLLETLQAIENDMGTLKTRMSGPRRIDIDILLMDATIMDTPTLKIPHPKMHLRRFVLVPLLEINLDIHHPVSNLSVTGMLNLLPSEGPMKVAKL